MLQLSEVETFLLRLDVAGQRSRSIGALSTVKTICEDTLHGRYELEVFDLLQNPALASGDQILAVPTLGRRLPTPIKTIIGDLSNRERVLIRLDLRAR